ncbi:sugar kinase [Congregibacter litoralis]|uniref:2-keto-3-deoxygluconate kinase n=1 Tax=Congregibacter litoralis KT71 TaxID=314285 RepID=A4AC73_9GAMM|nr:sugar kinase [Congregibacter litoralis]EAQ96301.1 2-keto-3-deoxygluconate kinase [Congregibacter litoralis KT71]
MSLSIPQSGFAAIGECMLELREDATTNESHPEVKLSLGFGGDTLNTAVYLARLGVPSTYVTALGDDARSQWLLDHWVQEEIDTHLVRRVPGRRPGVYWITTDAAGERSFDYWRGESPARELFDDLADVQVLTQNLSAFGMVYLSGITLSLYSAVALERLYTMLEALRDSGVIIGFDGNFRPAAWTDSESARAAFERVARLAHVVLPTFDDELMLFGDDSPEATIARLREWGVDEVVVKLGGAGCLLGSEGTHKLVATRAVSAPVDTTAAGDSFNAGYLAARYFGKSLQEAAETGNRLAGSVVMNRGAIIPLETMPEFT